MDPTGNFYNYRTALRGAAHRSRTANSNREKVELGASALLWLTCGLHFNTFSPQIVIPFFSLLIKDIYFLNEGCANRLPNGHVNFEVGLTPEPPSSSNPNWVLLTLPDVLVFRNLWSWLDRLESS